MDTILIILGVIGFGAIVISAYVFTVAARHYVSDGEFELPDQNADTREWVVRAPEDRRQGAPVTFPLSINGRLIATDRRQQPERRRQAA